MFLNLIILAFAAQIALFAEDPVILVTGGAGYIGSHTCCALKKCGFSPVIYDSLINGNPDAVKWGPLVIGDINDTSKLDAVFSEYKPIAVIHFAALRNVGESVTAPYEYYHTNVAGTLNLLDVMLKHHVKNIIFSSSCTVYGVSPVSPIRENQPRTPINPYANSKFFVEKILEDFARAYDLKYMILRYFNAAGMDCEEGLYRSPHSYNFLIPNVLIAILDDNEPLCVFGTDYPTSDGTAIRDYIHVKDLADAHVLSLQYLLSTQKNASINLGTGQGYSVFEVLDTIKRVTHREIPIKLMPRRDGDVPEAVADPELSRKTLNFIPRYSDLQSIVESEWKSALQARKVDIPKQTEESGI
jgi:UDP-glucose-4-epimerase GalE